MTRPHRVVFLTFPGTKMLDVTGPAEVFADANLHGARYSLSYVSPDGGNVITTVGTPLVTEAASSALESGTIDTLVVAGGECLVDEPIPEDLVRTARELAERSLRVASVCTGAFILAEAGLLDQRRATTHWMHTDRLAREHPEITVLPDALFTQDGPIFTSAGVSSGIDLALALVNADHGEDLARAVSRGLVVYMQRTGGQSQFSAALRWPSPTAPGLRKAVDAVTTDPGAEHSVGSLAALVNVSERHLTRLFKAELNLTPSKFLENVRLDSAKALLDAGHTVTETARLAGFGSDENLRRSFTLRYGLAPSQYRGRFHSAR